MSRIKGIELDTIAFQMRSFMIFDFLNEYNKLEHNIRVNFEEAISALPSNVLQQLYFYYGGRIATYVDYTLQELKIDSIKYKDNEEFRCLSINQIIKILGKNHCVKAFEFQVQSIQRSSTVFTFYDCVNRLIRMRNKIAHEVYNLSFKDAELIEMLTVENLDKQPFDLLHSYDKKKMDQPSLYMASNIVYMRMINKKLSKF